MENQRYTLSIYVRNQPGVLMRLASLFSRRGFNIDSLSVGETENKDFSRVTIVVTGDDYTLNQITMQLSKLVDVKKVVHLPDDRAVFRELMLIKVNSTQENRGAIMEIVNVFRGRIIDLSHECLVVEITGDSKKTNSFLNLLEPYGVIEIARTGLTALERGHKNIHDYKNYIEPK